MCVNIRVLVLQFLGPAFRFLCLCSLLHRGIAPPQLPSQLPCFGLSVSRDEDAAHGRRSLLGDLTWWCGLAADRCVLGGLCQGEALDELPSAKGERKTISYLLLP